MEKITIRRSQVSDAAAMAQLMSHPEVFSGLLQLPYPSEELWRARLQDNAVPGKPDLSLVAEVQGQVVGSAGLHPAGASLRRRHAMSLGISVAAEAQGRGIGRALMAALMDYADNWGQVLRTELTVYADNARAIRLYESFGFQREGLMRAYALRKGVYVDTLAMARLHPNPPRWN
ncbi:MAG: GNAT family N-acetyltransferase [Burkholderiales bacterium PBB2]|nr:MAG: GNAT family N-acetyltransferase [Burkholderiales bacterium PBB2]